MGKAFSDIVSVRRAVMAYVPKQEPRVVTATLGRPLRLDCDVPAGHPMPSVQWFRQVSECVTCAEFHAHPWILKDSEGEGGGKCAFLYLESSGETQHEVKC